MQYALSVRLPPLYIAYEPLIPVHSSPTQLHFSNSTFSRKRLHFWFSFSKWYFRHWSIIFDCIYWIWHYSNVHNNVGSDRIAIHGPITTLEFVTPSNVLRFVLFFVHFSRCTRLFNVDINIEYVTRLICKHMLTYWFHVLMSFQTACNTQITLTWRSNENFKMTRRYRWYNSWFALFLLTAPPPSSTRTISCLRMWGTHTSNNLKWIWCISLVCCIF